MHNGGTRKVLLSLWFHPAGDARGKLVFALSESSDALKANHPKYLGDKGAGFQRRIEKPVESERDPLFRLFPLAHPGTRETLQPS